jgi:FkbM family methyltransferase
MGWKGILAEASKNWHEALLANRPGSSICTECVWSRSGEELAFSDASQGVFSTISSFVESDHHRRQIVASYSVKTISLKDLLDEHQAPKFIEFLSIDTEGSEFDILSTFNWEDRTFGFIAVEHNYTDNRQKIHDLLTSKGYARVLQQHSKWDDWNLHHSLKCQGESKD